MKPLIEQVEQAPTFDTIPGLKKLGDEGRYSRIRVGDYRCGIAVDDDPVTFVRFLQRRDIYRYFP
jgi:mRNA interferase RelE/StbE